MSIKNLMMCIGALQTRDIRQIRFEQKHLKGLNMVLLHL